MRRLAIAAIPVLALLLMPGGAGATRTHQKTRAKCVAGHSRPITANAQAQVYEAREPEAFPEYLGVWGCVYGHSRPYFLGPLPYGSSSNSSAGVEHGLSPARLSLTENTIQPIRGVGAQNGMWLSAICAPAA